jgi:hypothetical protein
MHEHPNPEEQYTHLPTYTVVQKQPTRPSDGEASKELVAKRLGLGDVVEVSSTPFSIGEVEPLLHDGGELPNPAALLSKHVLGARGTDDDLRVHQGHTDIDAGVSILGQLPGQHQVQLSVLFEMTLHGKGILYQLSAFE